ncbi:MAG: T9SS type A sorting domain-containing protein [Flavobacteriaceae bacterium]
MVGLKLTHDAANSDIKVESIVTNNGIQYGGSKDQGGLGNSAIYSEQITLGTTMDFTNGTSSFWVGSPGENATNPYGLTMATNDVNQSTDWNANTVAMAPSAILKLLQFNSINGTGSVEVDQVKISTGTYHNTVASGDAEEFYTATTGDTYSVTLPYSGAGNSTFVVGSTAGTVGGDDPSATADGNVTVSGVPVGTDVTITMDDTANGGICNLSTTVTSPDCTPESPGLELKGVLDLNPTNIVGNTSGNNGKAIHLVATADIPTLNIYGIGVANNGGGTDANEIPLSFGTLVKGSRSNLSSGDDILLVRSASDMQSYFEGCYDDFEVVIEVGGNMGHNGDDAIELYMNGQQGSTDGLVETFGDPNVDGSGEAWDYEDSWAYKVNGTWIYGGKNCTDGAVTNSTSDCPYPFCNSLPAYDWTGSVSTAWHTDGNWAGGSVPDSASDVTISDGLDNYPMVSTNASANSVSVATGATLTVSESGSLTTTGDFTNAGTVTMNSDSQEFSSLIVGGTPSGDIDYNRFVNDYSEHGDDNIQWDLIGSPVDGLEISSFANDNPSLATSGDYYGIGTYDNSSQLWTNYTSASSSGVNFDMGLGYQMATSVASSTVASSTSFATTNNNDWPYVVTGTTVADGAASQAAQTFEINVRSLPAGGANYRVFKTTANSSSYFGNATALTLGVNTITVAAATFDRAVKIQVSSGDIAFNSLVVNGASLHGYASESVGSSSSFATTANATYTHVVTGCLANDGNNGEAQTFEINVTSLPAGGADYRIYRTTADSNYISGPTALSLGVNTITVNAVTFARTVKLQVTSNAIEYNSLIVNGSVLYGFNGATLSFEGSIATGAQTQAITDNSGSGGDYWNLVSNPYPSYLNLNTTSDETNNFVSVNGVSVYGWNSGSTGAYTVYNQISPTPSTPLYIAPGQGFFVSAESASSVSFTNAMQTTSGGDDFVSGRMDGSFTYFYLNLNEGDDMIANSMFYFDDGMGYGYDAGYDAEAFSQSTKIMSRMLEGNVGVGMQVNAMPTEALDDSTVIPLDVNQTAGTAFSIGLADVFNLAEDVEVYLEDTELQTFTDLRSGDYTINPENDLSGIGRFYLVFGTNSLGGNTMDESYITIYKPLDEDYISIEGLLNVQNAKVKLYNILGQEVLNTALKTNQSVQRISTAELASGVYVIKLQADNAVISKKLIIN